MQGNYGDASERLVSLDLDYFYLLGKPRMFVSVIPHNGPLGLSMKVRRCMKYNVDKDEHECLFLAYSVAIPVV